MMSSACGDGILNIDKPGGCTSHDVVARVRRLTGVRRVGHAGTLDPIATGVLLVCVGHATRVAEYLVGGVKTYVATVRLGLETDTLDADGTITHRADVPELSENAINEALAAFVGTTKQVPPAYSAIKQDGAPVYRRARRGEVVELAPRPVTIHRISLLDWRAPDLRIEVSCDPGTYVRSLARDLGRNLGPGAVLTELRRTRSGVFAVADAVSLDALERAAANQTLHEHLRPIASAFNASAIIQATPEQQAELVHGRPIAIEDTADHPVLLAIDESGQALAVLVRRQEDGAWWPKKVFAAPAEHNQES